MCFRGYDLARFVMPRTGSSNLIPIFGTVALVTIAGVMLVWWAGVRVTAINAELARRQEVEARLIELLSTLTDAETAQRGFLLTNDEQYLQPFQSAPARLSDLLADLSDESHAGLVPPAELDAIRRLSQQKMTELDETILLARQGTPDATRTALEIVRSNSGKQHMDQLRDHIGRLLDTQRAAQTSLAKRRDEATAMRTLVAALCAVTTLAFLTWAYLRIRRDIAQREAAERELAQGRQRLAGIVDSAMDAIISIDEKQNIILFNQAAEKVFRCTAKDAIGTSLGPFIPERYRTIHRQHVRRFGETGLTSRAMGGPAMVLSGVRADGEEFPIDASISQVQVEGHRIFTVILRDITERRKAEEEIHRFQAELEQRVQQRTAELAAANQELEAFGYTVSHDLRAPLRHVTSFVDLLDKHAGASLDEKGRRYVRTISEAGRRMANLIDDLLMLSRLGRATLSQARVGLRQLVDDAMIQLASEMVNRTIEWKIGELPEICGDPVLLRNVVINLLSNALKYTRGRDPAVIEMQARVQDGQVVCLVRDNGVGFDMRYVDKLFGVFQRLHRADEFEGTGVGLASVRRIIQRHGGTTWAEGELDKGATFYFSLPVREVCA